MVRYVQDFSKDYRPTRVHLGVARYLDMLGLTAERDRVLEIARERDGSLADRLRRWREGRLPLGDIERLYSGPLNPVPPPAAPAPRARDAPPGIRPDIGVTSGLVEKKASAPAEAPVVSGAVFGN